MDADTSISFGLMRLASCWSACLMLVCFSSSSIAQIRLASAVQSAAQRAGQSVLDQGPAIHGPDCTDDMPGMPALPSLDAGGDLADAAATAMAKGPNLAEQMMLAEQAASGVDHSRQSAHYPCPAGIRAALLYTQLAWDQLQAGVLIREHETAERLVKIERQRIVGQIDSELPLLRADLLEAWSRARELRHRQQMVSLRARLAGTVGSSATSMVATLDSIPEMPAQLVDQPDQSGAPSGQSTLALSRASLRATRDTYQLVYLLSQREAERIAGLGKSTLGQELEAQIRAQDAFADLLEATKALQCANIRLLAFTGRFADWALPGSPINATRISLAAAVKNGGASHGPAPLLLPADGSLTMRRSRQLAAISTGADPGQDVTSAVDWSSSNEAVLIVSKMGLMTAIRPGTATITARLGSSLKQKEITVTDSAPAAPLLSSRSNHH